MTSICFEHPILFNILNEIKSRGFIYQSSDIENLDKIMSKNSICGYIGFDITSDSLHIGSLVQLMLLHWLNYYDHKTIALLGGGTTLVGDPSGKDKERKISPLIQTADSYFIDTGKINEAEVLTRAIDHIKKKQILFSD